MVITPIYSNMAAEQGVLQFKSFQTTLDSGFWNELSKRKLEKYQLNDAPWFLYEQFTLWPSNYHWLRTVSDDVTQWSSLIGVNTQSSLKHKPCLSHITPSMVRLTVKAGTRQIDHSLYIEGVSVPDRQDRWHTHPRYSDGRKTKTEKLLPDLSTSVPTWILGIYLDQP